MNKVVWPATFLTQLQSLWCWKQILDETWSSLKVGLTSDADARLAFLLALGEHVKDAAVTALVVGPHPLDSDVAGVVVGGVEMHVGFLMADADRHALLVRQDDLVVPVEPAHLPDGVACCRGDVTAEQQGAACLCGQTGRSYDPTWVQRQYYI